MTASHLSADCMSRGPVQAGDRVLVTGANGYIAGWIVKDLLDSGFKVRGTVRSLSKAPKAYFDLFEAATPETLEFVALDKDSPPEAWDEALKGCTAVIHTASPVPAPNMKVSAKTLIEPTVALARVVGEACKRSSDIRKLCYTSSIVAVDAYFKKWKSHVYNGDDWNMLATETKFIYACAKIRAEKLLAEMFPPEGEIGFATMLPYYVIGPSAVPGLLNFNAHKFFVDTLRNKAHSFNCSWGMVDVRDVARAHVAALEHHEARGRFILAGNTANVDAITEEIMRSARQVTPPVKGIRAPILSLPYFILYIYASLFLPEELLDSVIAGYGKRVRFDHGPATEQLGLVFRDFKQTILDTTIYVAELMREKKMLKQ